MTFTTGMMIGKYELGKKLGQGGFGLVFIARDTGLDRDVALKFMHPEHTANAEILRRFLQEARSAAKIVHPGIVTVFECGQVQGTGSSSDGVAFIAMELLHGESLSDRLARAGRLPADHAMEIARQVASALEAAHEAGIIHRDLKPDNIFLVRDPAMPGGERVKVLDFGIAKLAQGQNTSGVQTQSMMVFGTPAYMSPEQCRSAAHIDHRSDIYTLGCILYELVVGETPFKGETGELIAKHQLVAPSQPRTIIGDLPEELDELINAMLAKNPADRPQTMTAVQRALEARGAMQAGVAPTLLPDESLPRFTPPAGYKRPASEPKRKSAPIAAVNTTLGGASGQWENDAPKKSKLPFVLGGVVALAIAGVAIYFGTRHEEPKVVVTTPSPPPSPSPSPSPSEKPVEDIALAIESTPKAEVWVGNNLLGETPYLEKRKPAVGKLQYTLKAGGYHDKSVLLAADKNDSQTVTLDPIVDNVIVKKPDVKKPDVKKPVDPDRDHDGVPDAKDKCPDQAAKTATGCPKRALKPGELPDDG